MPVEEGREGLERLLEASELLFTERGYSAVKLKHIAERIGVKESSIYYHFPKGKEELYIAAMQRSFMRHREGIAQAIENAGEEWVEQLRSVCYWLVSQPPIDVMRMSKSDFPAIDTQSAFELEETIYESVNLPIRLILEQADKQGKAEIADADLIAGMFVGMAGSIHIIKEAWNKRSRVEMVDVLLDSWVRGLRAPT